MPARVPSLPAPSTTRARHTGPVRRLCGSVLALLALAVAGCGDDSPLSPGETPPTGGDRPPALTITPGSATIGATVEVRGLDAARLATGALSATVDGVPAAVTAGHEGAALLSVPIPLDGQGEIAAPSSSAVDVELFIDGETAGLAEEALVVVAPPSAPGTADAVVASLTSILDDVQATGLAMLPVPSLEHGYATALFGAAQALLTGDDDAALPAQLAALAVEDPDALATLDAILASSGAADALAEVAGSLAALNSQQAGLLRVSNSTTELDQHDLAARMQLYVMVRDVGQQVIGQTTATWGAWLAPIFGGISFVGVAGTAAAPGITLAGAIGTALGLINTAVNNVALSYLPAQVDAFELVIEEPFVAPGAVAATEVRVTASNAPATITTLDLVDLVLNGMGVLPNSVPAGHPRRVALIQTIDYFLSVFRGLLSNYGAQYPDSDFGFDVASIPSMTWTARVTDTRYVEPLSLTPDVIDANGSGVLAWRAAIDGSGEGRIYARINNGPEVTSLAQIPGYTYNAGAFGDQVLDTDVRSVEVAAPIFVRASMDPRISQGGANGLEVRVGTETATGDTLWIGGAAVRLTATGGTVETPAGTTGSDGRFDTLVRLDPGSTSVTIEAVATAPSGREGSTTASARSSVGTVVVGSIHTSTGYEASARIRSPSGVQGTTFYDVEPRTDWGTGDAWNQSASLAGDQSGSFERAPGETMRVDASFSGSATAAVAPSADGATISLQANRSLQVSAENPPPEDESYWTWGNGVRGSAQASVRFVVLDEPVEVTITATSPAYARAYVFIRANGGSYLFCASGRADSCSPEDRGNGFSGTLEPGEYVAMVDLIGDIAGQDVSMGNFRHHDYPTSGTVAYDENGAITIQLGAPVVSEESASGRGPGWEPPVGGAPEPTSPLRPARSSDRTPAR